ncbi:uncharacterized protein LOC131155854 [Malania oleifera]|uniref:uncharacterized protein LOC131155854 n=1 Tax=Malania oleifera TaxID=397392 RepID=UPI0025AE8922|nr:uncharacterized protein LOC131155854 [Malania oleifera]
MGLVYAQGHFLALVMTASMLSAGSMANQNSSNSGKWASWNFPPNATRGSKRIVVGGSNQWRFGFNYAVWAMQNGPFHQNDTLVFKYDPPNNSTNTPPHSVYMLPNFRSYVTCDLKKAKLVATPTQGSGKGFEFVLQKPWQFYYFACGERNGIHCNLGTMKFFVMPFPHY